jgi:hypothetical protein
MQGGQGPVCQEVRYGFVNLRELVRLPVFGIVVLHHVLQVLFVLAGIRVIVHTDPSGKRAL